MVYLRPGWLQRKLEPMFMTRLPNQPYIRVRGRTTGQLHRSRSGRWKSAASEGDYWSAVVA